MENKRTGRGGDEPNEEIGGDAYQDVELEEGQLN